MIEIIPAIDLINGRCVRLSQGNFDDVKSYGNDPVATARQFEDAGFRRLHLVDLDGAKDGQVQQLKVLEKIALHTGLTIDFSGGIRSEEDIRSIFSAGATIAGIGSFAARNPFVFMEWVRRFGSDSILLGADVRDGFLAQKGWTQQTDISIFDFLKTPYQQGLRNVFCTDINTDGMLQGCSLQLYKALLNQYPELNLIASGGTATLKEIDKLDILGCKGVIIGKAIYEGTITLTSLKKYII